MRQCGFLIINVLAAMLLALIPFSTEAQMTVGSGHGSAHGDSKKPTMTRDKMHSGHGSSKAHHDHQATSMPKRIPKHLDVTTAKASEHANFNVGVTSQLNPVAINKIHNWVLQIKKPDGEPVEDAKVHISGGMPMHGHGLATSPRVTKYLGDGKYLIEGVRFNMAGWWELKLTIKAGRHKDKVTFNLILKLGLANEVDWRRDIRPCHYVDSHDSCTRSRARMVCRGKGGDAVFVDR